jgi:hypothetical protein
VVIGKAVAAAANQAYRGIAGRAGEEHIHRLGHHRHL